MMDNHNKKNSNGNDFIAQLHLLAIKTVVIASVLGIMGLLVLPVFSYFVKNEINKIRDYAGVSPQMLLIHGPKYLNKKLNDFPPVDQKQVVDNINGLKKTLERVEMELKKEN